MTSSPLPITAALHAVVAVACIVALCFDLPPITGVHPALKPLKFAVSIALLLGSLAYVLSLMTSYRPAGQMLAWVISLTMVIEMAVILAQALRGTSSHYNLRSGLDASLWNLMALAILVATVALVAFALVATLASLRGSPLIAFALRAGMWLVLLAVVSGAAMAGRRAHTVGAPDGGGGMHLTNWSTTHGDLRIPHFIALHGLQALPAIAAVLLLLPFGPRIRWAVLIAATVGWAAIGIHALVRAFAGRPW